MSSIQASYDTYPHSGTRLSQPPFRFRDLPIEIRNEIYHVCLVDHEQTAIEQEWSYDDDTLGDDEDSDNDEHVYLQPSRRGLEPTWGFNVLLVDKATYQEAVPVLYGFNEFQFHHWYPWRGLDIFLSKLPESSRRYLRRLDIKFPVVGRVPSSLKLSPRTGRVLNLIKRLPKLMTLTFRVSNDIMSRDLGHIRRINEHKGTSKVFIRVDSVSSGDDDGEEAECLIRISAAVVRLFDDFEWEVVGEFENVDEPNPFGNERLWLKCLEQEWMWCNFCEEHTLAWHA